MSSPVACSPPGSSRRRRGGRPLAHRGSRTTRTRTDAHAALAAVCGRRGVRLRAPAGAAGLRPPGRRDLPARRRTTARPRPGAPDRVAVRQLRRPGRHRRADPGLQRHPVVPPAQPALRHRELRPAWRRAVDARDRLPRQPGAGGPVRPAVRHAARPGQAAAGGRRPALPAALPAAQPRRAAVRLHRQRRAGHGPAAAGRRRPAAELPGAVVRQLSRGHLRGDVPRLLPGAGAGGTGRPGPVRP